ncbi:MAG: DUF3108 domain-containing protein [Steroidobacteraceae bacterium]|nr:DUF3108 domain-containing protein [Nevskiaceae bacterium]MCP5339022.1 DUF3108 domain-containing protein [Nevskiaceae bacterium]MCP5359566.1 DUF3108 domain-containing protein [Nevskiaceae bacterium]MCP5473034.1 DUF3108 domain-containing protein [Nevskiaceae bacterium]
MASVRDRSSAPALVSLAALTLLSAMATPAGRAMQHGGEAGRAAQDLLQPFRAEFVLEWKGMNAASASLELTRQSAGQYTYTSRNNARGVFRALLSGELVQISRLQLEAGHVRPLSYRGEDGSPDERRDVSLDFDWQRQRVTGTAEQRAVDLALQPGMQDIMSVQIALMAELQQGRSPGGYVVIDKDHAKDYVYAAEGRAQIQTAIGPLDTVIWTSHRPGSDRVIRVWYAPSLGHAPVKAERRRGNRLEWSMRLVSLWR